MKYLNLFAGPFQGIYEALDDEIRAQLSIISTTVFVTPIS
jgi:hypothetical protein